MQLSDSIIIPDGVDKPLFYSPLTDTNVAKSGNLPHWEQSGKTVFVTFRLVDSLPQEKLVRWREEETLWIAKHPQPWDETTRLEHDRSFDLRFERWLDAGYGECLMRDRGVQQLVQKVIRHFDGDRYRIYGCVVMPNHVHVCFTPLRGNVVATIIKSWKSFSSRQINECLGRNGAVWQKEYFDRYVRSWGHFERIMRYIKRNDPRRAWLISDLK